MKDKNEYGKAPVQEQGKRLRLGKVTLEFGSGSLSDENIDTFFASIRAVNVLTVRGLLSDVAGNLQYVADKLRKFGVECGEIRTEIIL